MDQNYLKGEDGASYVPTHAIPRVAEIEISESFLAHNNPIPLAAYTFYI
jgi:hypothetical protein